jgi:pimeloyl-ACP methyl ester carboxylesterase
MTGRDGLTTRRTRLIPICAALFLTLTATVLIACLQGRSDPPPMPGLRIDVNGMHMHAIEQGAQRRGPTIVLESGLGGGSFAWGWVQPQVAQFARVIAYDRSGLGWSEEAGASHDADGIARQLQALLVRIDARPPYILVGHSLGGIFVLRFATLYPKDVGGIVLVDAVSPASSGQVDDYDYRHPWRVVALGDVLAHLGLVGLFGIPPQIDLLPPDQRVAANYFIRSSGHWSAMLRETAEFDRSLQQARAAQSFGTLPIIAVTATLDRPPGWAELQRGLSRLSQQYESRSPPGTDHFGLVTDRTQATYTVAAIRDIYGRIVSKSAPALSATR